MSVAVIGLGTMGGRMAAALVSEGWTVVGYDVDPAVRQRARDGGLDVADDGAAAWGSADVVLVSLPGPAQCVENAEAIARWPGSTRVLVDLSTVGPQSSRDCAAIVDGAGVGFLDAPVLGRPGGCGSWTLPVGGSQELLDEVLPVLRVFSKTARLVGETGSGSVVKLLNNMMFAAINTVSVQVLDLAARVGLDPAVFYGTVVDSGAATVSPLFREVGRSVVEEDYTPSFSLVLLEKDNRLGVELGQSVDGSVTLNEEVSRLLGHALDAGIGGEDTAALIKVLHAGD